MLGADYRCKIIACVKGFGGAQNGDYPAAVRRVARTIKRIGDLAMSEIQKNSHISVEQQRYATWLGWGSRSGLAILMVTFLAYVFGWMPARIPLDQMPNVWNLSAHDYLLQTGLPRAGSG